MIRKLSILSIVTTFSWLLGTFALGQQTEVVVKRGQVKAQTEKGTVTVDAGRKAVLRPGQRPFVAVDDPMVDDLIQMYKWIEEERTAKRVPIDFASIQIANIETEQRWKGASLAEIPNMKSEPSDTCRIGPTTILKESKYYDLEGNLLPFELEKIDSKKGYYHIRFPKAVEPGQKFRFVSLGEKGTGANKMWKEGPLWNVRMANCTPNCLNYFRVILPKSAIFVDASRPVVITDSFEGRTTVTIRNYTGEKADGWYQIAFLWPEKDGTTLGDLPPQYRGLRSKRDELAEKYHLEMATILAGEPFEDQSTPLNALLSYSSAIVNKKMDLLTRSAYILHKNPQLVEQMRAKLDQIWDMLKHQFVDTEEFLGTPGWPAKPEDGYIHPIYTARKGSLLREDTLAFIYEKGKWYQFGNMGNARDTDVSVFRKHIPEIQGQVKLEALPWDNAGPAAIEVYKQFAAEEVKYPGQWFTLGIKLIGGNHWDQAFDCFQRCERLLTDKENHYYLSSLIWQGHVLDVLGKRDEAVGKYKAALSILDKYTKAKVVLKIEDYAIMRHDQWGIVLNYKWVRARLTEPFTNEMLGK